MRIKSKFKDYYDYIANMYGGGDPKIVYARDRINQLHDTGYMQYDLGFYVPDFPKIRELPVTRHYRDYDGWSFKWCVIAGKYYLLVGNTGIGGWTLFTKDHSTAPMVLRKRYHLLSDEFVNPEEYFAPKEASPELIELSRIVNAPVFVIRGVQWMWKEKKYSLCVNSNIPILNDLGFASVIPAEIMYQDISYFLGNIINPSPDMMPEPDPAMTDKERVLSHGFDLKTSFRHR